MSGMDAGIAACADHVQRGDPDRFLATMAAPIWMRSRLFTLYAFNLEVARAPWVTKEPMIAEMRLQFWRDVVEASATEAAPRAHEVAGPLHELIREAGLPIATMDALIEARRHDIGVAEFDDDASFDSYIEATGAGLFWLAARAVGAPDRAEPMVRALGWAAGLANYLCAVPELERRGRWPLRDGRPEAIAALAERGLARLDEARRLRRSLPAAAAPALLAGWQAPSLLKIAARDPAAVAEDRLKLSEFSRRGRLTWQAFTGLW